MLLPVVHDTGGAFRERSRQRDSCDVGRHFGREFESQAEISNTASVIRGMVIKLCRGATTFLRKTIKSAYNPFVEHCELTSAKHQAYRFRTLIGLFSYAIINSYLSKPITNPMYNIRTSLGIRIYYSLVPSN